MKTRRIAVALVLTVLACGLTLIAQQPVRDAPRRVTSGSAVLAGRVVGQDGRPIRRAAVTLMGAEIDAPRTLVTGDDGRFAFGGLPAGHYSIAAARPGYVTTAAGAKRPGHQGTILVLAEGQNRSDIDITFVRGGAISGTLTDAFGQPAAEVPLTLLRFAPGPSGRALSRIFSVPGSAARTDEQGRFRFYGLAAGEYVVMAVPTSRAGLTVHRITQDDLDRAQQTGRGVDATGSGQETFAPVYFPGTMSAASAATIALGAGEERDGIDFTLPLVTTARVEGIVSAPPEVLAQLRLSLIRDEGAAAPMPGPLLTAAVRPTDGSFTFNGVPPGTYRAVAVSGDIGLSIGGAGGGVAFPARSPAAGTMLWGMAPVVVDGRDVAGVSVSLQPAMSVSGRTAFAGTAAVSSATVTLLPQASGFQIASNPRSATVQADGTFTVSGLLPGRYALAAQAGPSWMLRSAMLDGADRADAGLVVEPGQHVNDLVVTFSDRLAEIGGALEDASGQPTLSYTVIAYPADRVQWTPQSRRIAAVRPNSDGTFRISPLPPGEYLLAAVDDIEPYEWFDPEVLAGLMPASLRITLAEGEKKIQNLRLAGR